MSDRSKRYELLKNEYKSKVGKSTFEMFDDNDIRPLYDNKVISLGRVALCDLSDYMVLELGDMACIQLRILIQRKVVEVIAIPLRFFFDSLNNTFNKRVKWPNGSEELFRCKRIAVNYGDTYYGDIIKFEKYELPVEEFEEEQILMSATLNPEEVEYISDMLIRLKGYSPENNKQEIDTIIVEDI
jgi:hypothetical protein